MAEPPPAQPLPRADTLTTQVAQRIAALPALADRDAPVELTLDPPELGPIRVSVSRSTDGMILHLQADQPETLDLLRRHGGALMQELQRQGLDHAGFSFSGRNDGGQRHVPPPPVTGPADDPAPNQPAQSPPAPTRAARPSGLDMRL